jgi:pyroglutamyl-peptidase
MTLPSPIVLLTGFDPFGGETINPSWEAVARLHGATIADHRVESVQLPTAFVRGANALLDAMDRHRPALVLCVGQAGGRGGLSLERIAINLIDALIPDNDAAQPIDIPSVAGAPPAYFSTLPIKAMHAALQTAGIRSDVSHTAGTFVCNHVFYVLMHALAAEDARVRGGFIHVPNLPEQALRFGGTASMMLDTMIAGLRIAINTALRTHNDLIVTAGATH